MIDITENAIKRIKISPLNKKVIFLEFQLMVEDAKASLINFLLIKLREMMITKLILIK